jgi:RNase P subunit RPR2
MATDAMVNVTPSPADLTAVLCPRCQLPMMRGTAKPIMFTSGLSDVSYSCEACGTETRRTLNRDGTPHAAAVKAGA